MLLYTGTFEAYQGLELLYEALSRVSTIPNVRLLMVGGNPEQVDASACSTSLASVSPSASCSRASVRRKRCRSTSPPATPSSRPARTARTRRSKSIRTCVPESPSSPPASSPIPKYSTTTIAMLTEPNAEAFAARHRVGRLRSRPRAGARREARAGARMRSTVTQRYLERTRRLMDFVSEKLDVSVPRESPAPTE